MYRIVLALCFLSIVSCGSEESSKKTEKISETVSNADVIQKGNVLFSTNCKICHSIDENTPTSLGPVLDSIRYHWPEKEILHKYIKNAPNMMQQTERSRKVYQQWKNKAQMPAFAGLNAEEINCIIEYLYNNT